MTLSEYVLRDLLLEHGIEGVTLWHIKALAELLRVRAAKNWRISRWSDDRWNSDVRGEGPVIFEAENTNLEIEAQRKTVNAFANRDRREIESVAERCVNCGRPATTECWNFVGSFVCGQPLCANCKHKH